MEQYIPPKEADEIWEKEFKEEFETLGKLQQHNNPERNAFMERLVNYKKDGAYFSVIRMAKYVGVSRTSIGYYKKKFR